MKLKILLIMSLISTILSSGCDSAYPFMMVEVCLGNEASYTKFVDLMQSIAEHNRMEFYDSSKETEIELNGIANRIQNNKHYSHIINLGFKSKDGAWVMAVNSAMPRGEVAVGFSGGSKPEDAKTFATKVIEEIKHNWDIEYADSKKGATAMSHCDIKE